MAFANRNLHVIAYAGGWTLWLYRTHEETTEDLQKENYFQRIKELCATGDIIYLVGKDTTKQMYIVLEDGNITLRELGKQREADMTKKQLESWLDTLNEISAFVEQYITCEQDKVLLSKLDKVIDGLYTEAQNENR